MSEDYVRTAFHYDLERRDITEIHPWLLSPSTVRENITHILGYGPGERMSSIPGESTTREIGYKYSVLCYRYVCSGPLVAIGLQWWAYQKSCRHIISYGRHSHPRQEGAVPHSGRYLPT